MGKLGANTSRNILTLLVGLGLLLLISAPSAVAEGACENEGHRLEQLSTLPDCRAYELVTPSQKDSSEPTAVPRGLAEGSGLAAIEGAHASEKGGRIAWDSEYSLPGSDSPGLDYLSTRTGSSWTTENVVPPQSVENGALCLNLVGIVGWSSDLSRGLLADGAHQEKPTESFLGEGGECGHDEPRLEASVPEGFQNLFVRNNDERTYKLVNVTPTTAPVPAPSNTSEQYFPAGFVAGSSDLGNVVFEEELPLTEEAEKLTPQVEQACKNKESGCWEGHDELYEWSEDGRPAVRLATILPDGKPAEGRLAGATRNVQLEQPSGVFVPINIANSRHAMSADGSRVFFEAGGNLYVRENGGRPQSLRGPEGECTEEANACTVQLDAPRGGSGTGGGGKFLVANTEGTKVYFTDGDSAGLTKTTVSGSGTNLYLYEPASRNGTKGTLTDLTPATNANVLGLAGASDDGSYIYFVAQGVLASNQNGQEALAQQGQPNLYVLHSGITTFIATLSAEDTCDWTSNTGCIGSPPETSGLTSRASTNGLYLGFNSVARLTGYDNTDSVTTKSDKEVFLYDVATNVLSCVSCNPSGPPMMGGAAIHWPAPPDTDGEARDAYPQRNVSDAGQVFFETREALAPQDTDGTMDVYEYENGLLYLISGGTSEAGSYFLDASTTGSDVFFATAQSLTRTDTDGVYDIYDARINGGFTEPTRPAPPCMSETCRETAVALPAVIAPVSVTFAGPDNVAPTAGVAHKAASKAVSARRKRLLRALSICKHKKSRGLRHLCERRARRAYATSSAKAPRPAGPIGRGVK